MHSKLPTTHRSLPTAPELGIKDLWRQFSIDVSGKEVQDAATYSYLWMADQVGHMGLGIAVQTVLVALLDFIKVTADSVWAPLSINTNMTACIIASILFSKWEFGAYRRAVGRAKLFGGRFPINHYNLFRNARIATAYMSLGAIMGYGFHLEPLQMILVTLVSILLSILMAPDWLRDKIIWQKAGIPFLFRLAEMRKTITQKDADKVQAFIDRQSLKTENTKPQQLIIFGGLSSGRSSLACGIGTELAFRHHKLRYLSFDKLMELMASGERFTGPRLVRYWNWQEAQSLIIDDVANAIFTGAYPKAPSYQDATDRFVHLMRHKINRKKCCLDQQSSIWVIGDVEPQYHQSWVSAIENLCKCDDSIVVALNIENAPAIEQQIAHFDFEMC